MILEATNFQSWDKFALEVEGLTVIIGDSNLGKSAAFRALRGVLRNDVGASRVKHGTDSCTIKCTYEGVNAQITRPRKGSVTYVVNGADYSRLAKEVPKEIKALNFEPVEIGSVKLDPIFAGQFGSQFLLEASPAELGQVLGAFASTEKLERGRKQLRTLTSAVDKEAELLAGVIERAQDELAAAETLVDKTRAVEDQLDQLEAVIATKLPVCELLTQILDASAEIRRLRPLTSIKIPQIEPVQRLHRAMCAADVASTSTRAARRAKKFVETLQVLSVARERVSQSVQSIEAINELLEVHEIDVEEITAVIDAHKKPQARAKTLAAAAKQLDALIENLSGAATLKWEIKATEQELDNITEEREAIQAQIAKEREAAAAARAQKELEAKQVQCPECGVKFVPERV